jgi:predicted Ser/Thr protein kinase
MNIIINEESVAFQKFTPLGIGNSSEFYCDSQQRYFLKKIIRSCSKFTKEFSILERLKKYDDHFPKLVTYTENYIVTEFIHGERLTKKNAPANLYEQADRLLTILENEHINHNDIQLKQIIISDGNVVLTDFGNSFIYNDPPLNMVKIKLIIWRHKYAYKHSNDRRNLFSLLQPFLTTSS